MSIYLDKKFQDKRKEIIWNEKTFKFINCLNYYWECCTKNNCCQYLSKKENIKNNNINYKKTNNLKRNKKQNNNQNIIGILEDVITTIRHVRYSCIFSNNKIYFSSYDRKVYEYYQLELINSDLIYMKEQIKRGLYLYYKEQNPTSKIKKIININLENLILSNVVLEEKQKNKSYNSEEDINICPDFYIYLENRGDYNQNINTIICYKQITQTNTFQKINGFSKSESTANNNNWSLNANNKVIAKYSSNAGVPLVFGTKIEVTFDSSAGKTWGKSETHTMGNSTNSADKKIKTTIDTQTINIPHQSIMVPKKSMVPVFVVGLKNNIQLILNYYQNIEGNVSTDIIYENNKISEISISIIDVMIKLSEKNILHLKIKINDDNSINFSYGVESKKDILINKVVIDKSIPLI